MTYSILAMPRGPVHKEIIVHVQSVAVNEPCIGIHIHTALLQREPAIKKRDVYKNAGKYQPKKVYMR